MRTKLVNNYLAIISCAFNAEAIALSQRFGLSLEKTLDVIHGTTATNGQLKIAWPAKVLKGDTEPGFTIDLAHKDLTLIVEAANARQGARADRRRRARIVQRGPRAGPWRQGFLGDGRRRCATSRDIDAPAACHEDLTMPHDVSESDRRPASIRPTARPTSIPRTSPTSSASSPARRGRARPGDRRGADGVQEVVADDAAGAVRHPRPRRHRDPRAQGRARPAALARAGQAARGRRSAKPRAPARSSSSSPAKRCAPAARRSTPSRPGIDVEVTREPLGVVAAITPWNFPLAIPAWKIAPALAFGNCVVFKPAELVPASPWTLADIVQRAGLPAGVLNLVMGPGSTLGAALAVIAGHRCGELHRLAGRRSVGRGRRGEDRRARAARDGRQEPAHRARRCGSGDGGVGRGQRRVLPGGPALHRVEPAHRHRGHPRSLRRRDDRAHEDAGHRRRAEAGHGDRPGRGRAAARRRTSSTSRSAEAKARAWRTAANG